MFIQGVLRTIDAHLVDLLLLVGRLGLTLSTIFQASQLVTFPTQLTVLARRHDARFVLGKSSGCTSR